MRDALVTVSASDIDFTRACDAFRWNSMRPEQRAEMVRSEYVRHMQGVEAALSPLATTDEQRATLAAELERYRTEYIERLYRVLAATGRTASAMVTGPARFPTRRNEKALDAERRASEGFAWWQTRAQKAMRALLAGSASTESLAERIGVAEEAQRTMLAANKIVRDKKLSDDEKVAQMVALGMSEKTAREALKPDFAGRTGFPSYVLANNAAKIRRMKTRTINTEASDEQ